MARYYLKPILWNTNNYRMPSGVPARGYPAEHGFGHEEWNNADFMRFEEQGQGFRAFHAEGLKNAPVALFDGQIFVFMYASHDRVQELVGIAGRATCLALDERKEEREGLVRRLGLQPRWREAWQLPIVKACHENNRQGFEDYWDDQVQWIPSWICPEDLFFWPEEPIALDATQITGKQKLLTMFNSYTEIGPETSIRVLESVPEDQRPAEWHHIRDAVDAAYDDPTADVAEIQADETIEATTKDQLIDARLGQGRFRAALMARWGRACAVSGCDQPEVLRASHIKPWRLSSNRDRLDPRNGLLLSANLDALFDRGLISFANDGSMVVSSRVAKPVRELLNLAGPLRSPLAAKERNFLAFHRDNIFWP